MVKRRDLLPGSERLAEHVDTVLNVMQMHEVDIAWNEHRSRVRDRVTRGMRDVLIRRNLLRVSRRTFL